MKLWFLWRKTGSVYAYILHLLHSSKEYVSVSNRVVRDPSLGRETISWTYFLLTHFTFDKCFKSSIICKCSHL